MTDQTNLRELANCIRFLSIDAIEKSKSGHPGMPMGMADVATVLFTEFLKFNPKAPNWINRDRFVLSAGHGSMLIYSLLYLTGYEDISLNDIKNFRQLGAKCAGHPEYGHISGIETTTGPLGQGIANSVGMAISEKLLAERLGKNIINHKIYCIAGDGCLMEGISQEAISLAGHLKLNNLVVLWDNNTISIDGDISITSSENMQQRFEACGWRVIKIDGHNYDEIRKALQDAQKGDKPVMIDCKTTIAFGSPNKAGSEKSHGSPLGSEEVAKTRENLSWNYGEFEIPQNLLNQWKLSGERSNADFDKWNKEFSVLEESKKSDFQRIQNKELPQNFSQKFADFKKKILSEAPKQASRKSSQVVFEFLTKELSELIGGSADLTGSVLTKTAETTPITPSDFSGRFIHYGIREHAMGAVMNGIALHSKMIPYSGTFLVFSDYMKPAIRLAALMEQQVIYVLTHDSIGLGEDGPTHQPIEHLAMLRAVPNLNVFRPCDLLETAECYELALQDKKTPSAMIFSRQNLPFVSKTSGNCKFGAYILVKEDESKPLQAVLIATGSEVEIAIEAQQKLQEKGINARVVSAPSLEIFDRQEQSYRDEVLAYSAKYSSQKITRVAVEAAISQGWERYIGRDGIFIGMNSFGASGKAEDLYQHFGITSDKVAAAVVNG